MYFSVEMDRSLLIKVAGGGPLLLRLAVVMKSNGSQHEARRGRGRELDNRGKKIDTLKVKETLPS